MMPLSVPPAEQLNLLRQQLILAQVRIMELEDERDERAPKLADLGRLLDAAQALADEKLTESAHLASVLADLQAQFDHLRHMQHVTNEALNASRADFARTHEKLTHAEQLNQQLKIDFDAAAARTAVLQQAEARLGAELSATSALAASRAERIDQLDAQLRTMKNSLSWRWTAWMRSIERLARRLSSR